MMTPEGFAGTANPVEQAQADTLRDRTESTTIAGAFRAAERQLAAREQLCAAWETRLTAEVRKLLELQEQLRQREEALTKRESDLVEQVRAARELVRQAHREADDVLVTAHKKSNTVVGEAANEAENIRTKALADCTMWRDEAAKTFTAAGQVADEVRKIPPTPLNGAAVAESIGKHTISTLGTLFARLMEQNPEGTAKIAKRVERFVASAMGGEAGDEDEAEQALAAPPSPSSATPEAPAPAPAWNVAELQAATEQLGDARIQALLAAWGLTSMEQMTSEHIAALIETARTERGHGDQPAP